MSVLGYVRSSGTTAIATSGDTAVDAIADGLVMERQLVLINEGSVAGFWSIDGGTTWSRLPANCAMKLDRNGAPFTGVKVKRVAGGSDLSGVYVSGW